MGALFANSILYMENIDMLVSRNIFNYLLDNPPTLLDLKDEYLHFYNSYMEFQRLKIECPASIIAIE